MDVPVQNSVSAATDAQTVVVRHDYRAAMLALLAAPIISLIGMGVYGLWGFFIDRQNSLDIDDQPLSDVVVIRKLEIGERNGGYLVVRDNPLNTGTTIFLPQPMFIPRGMYKDVSIETKPEGLVLRNVRTSEVVSGAQLVSGDYYAMVYEETDGVDGYSEKDALLKDRNGKYMVKRFHLE